MVKLIDTKQQQNTTKNEHVQHVHISEGVLQYDVILLGFNRD